MQSISFDKSLIFSCNVDDAHYHNEQNAGTILSLPEPAIVEARHPSVSRRRP